MKRKALANYHAGKCREEATAGVGTDALKLGIKVDQLVEDHLRVFLKYECAKCEKKESMNE